MTIQTNSRHDFKNPALSSFPSLNGLKTVSNTYFTFQIPIDFWLVKKMTDNLLKCSNLRCLQNGSHEKLKKQTKFAKLSSGCDLIKHKMLNVF